MYNLDKMYTFLETYKWLNWPRGIYPMNARVVQHMKINECSMPYQQNKG